MKPEKRSIKPLRTTMKSWLRSFFLTSCLAFVAISTISCCSTAPPEVKPDKQFKSLTHLKQGEKAPKEGWWMSEKDFEDMMDIIAEVVRESSDE